MDRPDYQTSVKPTGIKQVRLCAGDDCHNQLLGQVNYLPFPASHQREFFSLIDTDLSTGQTFDSSDLSHFGSSSESKGYIQHLLECIERESSLHASANFVCEEGKVVSLPIPVLGLAWPGLATAVRETLCCSSDVTIFVPCEEKTMLNLKEMIFGGLTSELNTRSESLLLRFLSRVGLNLNTDRHFTEEGFDLEDPETFFIEESFDDEYQVEDEKQEIEESSIEHFWPRKVAMKPVSCVGFCSTSCTHDCQKLTKTWSDDDIQIVKNIFRSEKVSTAKIKMLRHLEVQGNVGSSTDGYVILGQEFCLKFLSHLTGSSVYLLRTVLEDYWRGVIRYEHGNKGMIKNVQDGTMNFIVWFKSFLSLYGQSAPDDQVTVLNYWLKGKVLYKMFMEEAPKPHIRLTTFYQHLKKYFGPKRIDQTLPCHRISKYSSHSICDVCVALNANQKLCKTEAELNMTKALRNQHKIDFGMARRTVESLRQSAIDFPNDSLFIQLDGMDNSKSYVPRFLENSKKLVGTERLPSKIQGCILWSGLYKDKRKDIFYINHDHFGEHLNTFCFY